MATPLTMMLWPETDTVTDFPLAVTASQIVSLGTSLLLIHRHSPLVMVSLTKYCDTVCVVGVPPWVQPAHGQRRFRGCAGTAGHEVRRS